MCLYMAVSTAHGAGARSCHCCVHGGHDVYTPTLTGMGEHSHIVTKFPIDLDIHICDVVATLHYEDLHDAILVGHSYGGAIITGVADRALDRVGHLVYLDAVIPEDGETVTELRPEKLRSLRQGVFVVDGIELIMKAKPEDGHRYGVSDPDDLAWMQDRFTPQPLKTFEQPLQLTNPAAVKRLPRTNINSVQATKLRAPDQQARAAIADRVWEIDTGHDIMITEPKALADMLLKLA
jgi:pimeloyl-ACP methyl ester carboxylesterase